MPAAKPSRLFSFLPICLLLLLTACGTAGNQTSSTQATPTPTAGDPQQQPTTPANPPPSGLEYVYFGFSGDIYGYELQEDGSLAATPHSPYAVGGDTQQTSGLIRSQTGDLGFATTSRDCPGGTCYGTNSISSFSISATTGELHLLDVQPTGQPLGNSAVDDTGNYLYASGYYGLRIFSISRAGSLTEGDGSPFPSIFGTLLKDPLSNRFFIVGWHQTDWQTTYITSFSPDPQNGRPVMMTGPTSFESSWLGASTIDSQGKYIVAADVGQLHVFSVSSEISEVKGSPFPANCDGRSVSIDPTGSWLYCTSTNGRIGIAQYPFDKGSGQIANETSFVPSGPIFQTLSFAKEGSFLIASSVPTIDVYRVDSVSGNLGLVRNYTLF